MPKIDRPNRHAFDLPDSAARIATKARKTEVLWCGLE